MRHLTTRTNRSVPEARPRRWAILLLALMVASALGSMSFAAPAGAATTATVSGVVRFSGTNTPVPNAHVSLREVGLVGVTDANGAYSIPNVPLGDDTVDIAVPCRFGLITSTGPINGNTTVDFDSTFSPIVDGFGHVCKTTNFALIGDQATLPLTGDDASVPVNLPFAFPFYGSTKTSMKVSTN